MSGAINLFTTANRASCHVIATGLLALLPFATQARDTLRLVYADWSSSVASAHVVCAVVRQQLDHGCEAEQVSVEEMYERVAQGKADATLSAWLPDTHRVYMQRYAHQLDDLGPNFEATRIGLVVPAVSQGRQTGADGARGRDKLDIQSIAELNDHAVDFAHRIIGIEADTGIMRAARKAMETYGLRQFRLIEGSESTMAASLKDAIRHKQPVVITGWQPHWLFGRWALRFLDDPKGVFGKTGAIHTLVRPGLHQAMPRVYTLLDRFHWQSDQLGQLMVWIQADGGRDPAGQAERWLRTRGGIIEHWLGTQVPE